MTEENLISYYQNWGNLKPGDIVFSESLQNIAYKTIVVPAGDIRSWRIFKKETINGKLHFTGTGVYGSSFFNDNTCDENDIKIMIPSAMLPLGSKVKFFIQKEKPLTERVVSYIKNIFNK